MSTPPTPPLANTGRHRRPTVDAATGNTEPAPGHRDVPPPADADRTPTAAGAHPRPPALQQPLAPSKPHGEEDLLTVADVCAWFKVTRRWVYDEVEAGRLPYLRIGRRHLRFRRTDLNDYLTAHTGRKETRRTTTAGRDLIPHDHP